MKWCREPHSIKLILAVTTIALSSCQTSRYITPPTRGINATLNSLAAEGDGNFSYNGRYLVYTSDRAAKRSVYLYDLQRRRLIRAGPHTQPTVCRCNLDS